MSLTIGSLFSGIGGLELGLERAGLGPVLWQCEVDPFCRSVLEKHWPTVRRFNDVTQPRRYPDVDVICGGFPCQDVSSAGRRAGLAGARSGLWHHFARVVEQVAPTWVVVENVASGSHRWLPTVRRHLHLLGYDSTAFALSAADVGAPHLRRRVFVVAHANVRMGKGAAVQPGHEASLQPAREGQRVSRPWQNAHRPRRRVDDGVPRGLDESRRIRAGGNAVVPQCAEAIGRMIGLRSTSARKDPDT